MPQAAGTDFTKGNMMRHVTVMSFTSSIGIMAIYVVDLLDIFFVSLLGQQEIAAAAGFASTTMFFISAVSIGISVASGTLTAHSLGFGQRAKADEATSASIVIGASVGILMPLVMFPFLTNLVGFLGATGQVQALSVMYLQIVLPASCLSSMSMCLVASMRAHGFIRWAMYPSLVGAAVNLVFDPLLIFGLDMGLAGAATATVMARLATFELAFYASFCMFRIASRPDLPMVRRHIRELLYYAMPSVLSSIAAPVGLALITRQFTKYGAEAVAGIAVIGRLSPVIFSVINALSGAIGPIIAQNHAAGQNQRVHRAYFDALKFLAIYVAIAIALMALFRAPIANTFNATGLTRDLLYFYCGPYAMVAFFNGLLFVSSAAFNSLGRPNYAPRLNWAKNTLGIFVFAMPASYLWGMYGLAIGLLVNAGFFAVVSHYLSLKVMKQVRFEAEKDEEDEFDETGHLKTEYHKPLYT